ncbi:hypothetical protein EL22_21665 [Halostagnicola sp. A56]|uniref:hypothetical protein n=1 Tax=Halostagnicola sp. A56 TaxID=1495067 RepID=UPI00049F98F7|nr:hypothetical protein [Halostagnicola sp. A56]KDE59462.1 hypothetical protein EL22_21665 [Halostagnicola sp. A56]
MTRSSRRHLLAGGAGLIALTAGCLDSSGLAASPGPGNDADNETSDDGTDTDDGGDTESSDAEGDDSNGEPDDGLESTTTTFQHGDRPEDPTVDLLTSEDQADRWVSDRSIGDAVSEFVDETDFEEAGVIALEAGANTACYELAVESVGLEDETVTVHAEVTQTGDENQLCAQQLTAVGALVRASIDGEQPDSISVTIVDVDGDEHGRGISVSSGSASASASKSVSTNRSEGESGSDGDSETDTASD